jgi:hypothetical protein
MNRALIFGPFGVKDRGCTFGDVHAAEVVASWLTEKNIEYDIVNEVSYSKKNIEFKKINPKIYNILFYVCGPFGIGSFKPLDVKKDFKHCKKIAVNVSVDRDDISSYQGHVDYIIARDSGTVKNPDLVFNIKNTKVPVIGVLLIHSNGPKGLKCHEKIKKEVWNFFDKEKYARIDMDTIITTKKNINRTRVYSSDILDSLICRCDAIISNRLHGVVYALKNKIPVLAIDPIIGGHKVQKQIESIKWPCFLSGENATAENISLEMKKILEGKYTESIKPSLVIAKTKSQEIKNQLYSVLDSEI